MKIHNKAKTLKPHPHLVFSSSSNPPDFVAVCTLMESSQKLQLDKQRRRQHELERATAKEKEMEELRKKQEEKVQAAMKRNEEKTDMVVRENKEMEVKILKLLKLKRGKKVLRENNEKAAKVLRENNASLALLMDENKAEMAALVEKQEKEDRLARKRKADGPVAPECPVCAILYTCVHFESLFAFCPFCNLLLCRFV